MSNWLYSSSGEDAPTPANGFLKFLADLCADARTGDLCEHESGDPQTRLKVAIARLPLPAAFRDAAVAIRAIIRLKQKSESSFTQELSLLYWIAAVDSFTIPYAHRLKEPGFNVIVSIPGLRIRSLPIEYQSLGYKEILLLNQTDRKWLIEAWGEPESHSTLNTIHRNVWDEYETRLIIIRRAEQERFVRELQALQSRGAK